MKKAVVLTLMWFAICAAPLVAEDAPLPLAPDGVRYLNRDSWLAMQEKPLDGNLLRNGSFEDGRWWPAGWDPCDKLGTLWTAGGTQGNRCIRLDTNILESQWLPWNENVLKLGEEASGRARDVNPQSLPADPIPAPPPRRPTKPPYYDTVGGNHGIHYRSEFIKYLPGAIYRFSCDVRNNGKGDPMVFVKGFFDQHRQMEGGEMVLKRNAYRAEMTLTGTRPQWQRFARLIHPAESKSTVKEQAAQIDWLRVELYAYWPVGTYDFDNVRLEIVGYEKVEPLSPATTETKDAGTGVTTNADDFPVIK